MGRQTTRLVYVTCFSLCVMIAFVGRIVSIAYYASYKSTRQRETRLKAEHANVVYLTGIAAAQCLTAVLLLRLYISGKGSPPHGRSAKVNFARRLCRATEIRNSLLCIVGVARLIVFAVKSAIDGGWNAAAGLNRLFYNLDCFFVIVLM